MRGMSRVEADAENIRKELNEHWEVVSEGAQTILRAAGRGDAYESLKFQTRGHVFNESRYRLRERLMSLSPEEYIGLAIQITDEVVKDVDE